MLTMQLDSCGASLTQTELLKPSTEELSLLQILEQDPLPPEQLKAFRLISNLWGLPKIFQKIESHPGIKSYRIHPVFRIPVSVFSEVLRSVGILLETQPDPDFLYSLQSSLEKLLQYAEKIAPVNLFFEEQKNAEFIGLWYEIRSAAHYAARDFKILDFRKAFRLSRSQGAGEVDLVVKSPQGEIILVEVKKRLHRGNAYEDQFRRFEQILDGETDYPWKIDRVEIFVPQGYSEYEAKLLTDNWPRFQAGSLTPSEKIDVAAREHSEYPFRSGSVSKN